MQFRSELSVPRAPVPLRYPQAVLLMGSCFTEHIADRLNAYRFPVLQNPHGILFNPISITQALVSYIEEKQYGPQDLFELNGLWSSWDHHGRFSSPDREACLDGIQASQTLASAFLRGADWLILTLGSGFIYELKGEGRSVANCHKAPQDWFRRRLLTVEEVLSALDPVIHRLFYLNSRLRLVFTISPVRHLREGMVDNNRNKAVLIQAVHHLASKFDRIDYFPAYELVVDDLRDYRFYAEDMVHPNHQATEYVWEKFREAWTDHEAQEVMDALDPILIARRHRALHPQSANHRKFLERMGFQCEALMARYPFLDLSADLAYFRA